MPREPLPLKREKKGEITIDIGRIFRNEDVQKQVIKNCKKINPTKNK